MSGKEEISLRRDLVFSIRTPTCDSPRGLSLTIQAQPETTFKDLLEQVYEALQVRNATEFQVRIWDRDADRLLKVSRGGGLEIKAHLAALRGQDEDCDRLYSAALRIADDYAGAVARYLSVLATRLRPEKLLEVYRDIGTAFEGNPQATRFVEGVLAGEGFVVSAWKLSGKLSKMGSFSASTPGADSEQTTQLMSVEGYEDADFGAPIAFAKRFLASRKIEQQGVRLSPSVSEENGSTIFFQIRIDQSPEDAVDTEMELFEALEVEAFPLESQGKIVLSLIGTRVALD